MNINVFSTFTKQYLSKISCEFVATCCCKTYRCTNHTGLKVYLYRTRPRLGGVREGMV